MCLNCSNPLKIVGILNIACSYLLWFVEFSSNSKVFEFEIQHLKWGRKGNVRVLNNLRSSWQVLWLGLLTYNMTPQGEYSQ
jgi:hypothetical protein